MAITINSPRASVMCSRLKQQTAVVCEDLFGTWGLLISTCSISCFIFCPVCCTRDRGEKQELVLKVSVNLEDMDVPHVCLCAKCCFSEVHLLSGNAWKVVHALHVL